MDVLLGFDLGTTRFKVVAFDLEGRSLAAAVERNREHTLGDYRWQDPLEWWESAGTLARQVMASPTLAGATVRGIGLSARAGGFVPVDASGSPVAPSWSDTRHADEFRELDEWRRGGAHLSNYAAAPLAKYRWLLRVQPEVGQSVSRLLYAKDWLLLRMTGRAVVDPTSGPDALDFDRPSIATLGIDPSLLPEVDVPWAVAGELTSEAAQTLGIPAGTPVAVGGHDGICANLGAGAGEPGAYAITIGTHAVVRTITESVPAGAYRFYDMPPGRHVIGGNATMAGRAADWFLDGWLGSPAESARRAAFARMDAEAEAVAPGAEGARFLPFLNGQVAPEPRPGASAAFAGLREGHGRPQMYRAVLEGGAFAIRAIWEQITGWCGAPRVARFTGTGALSEVWRQIIVDCIDWPCEVIDGYVEARGAAIYAAVATGVYQDVDVAARAMVHPAIEVRPDPARVEVYRHVYQDWRRVSDAMRSIEGGR